MKRRWKVILWLLAALGLLLALNTIVLDQETEPAAVTVPGGRILSLNGGDLQVLDLEPLPAASSAPESLPGTSSQRAPSDR